MSTIIDFRDDISVNLIGLKDKDFEYINNYCKKHSYAGCGMTLEDFVMNALGYYLKKLRAEDNKDTMTVDKTSTKESFNMENKTIEFDVGLKRCKFNVVKLKDCKYFIEDVTYTNPIEYTVNLMLYPEDSPNVDCAIIIINPASFLTPIEVEEDGSVTNKSITLYYEFDGDSDYYAAFEAKYIDRIRSILSSTASDIINRNYIPQFHANCIQDEEDAVSHTKAEIGAFIDDCIYRRHSMTNLIWYLDKLRKEERDELY